MNLKLSFVFLLGLISNIGISQNGNDTILFINGTSVISTITDTTDGLTTYVNPKKTKKTKTVDNDNIFSVKNKDGEHLIYMQDTLGNELTVDEMRHFIRGQQDASKVIKGNGGACLNFLLSLGAGATGSFLTPVIPFAVSGLLGLPRVKIKNDSVSKPEDLNNDAYLMGYEKEGKRKRKVRSLLGGAVGLVVGLGTSVILKANGDEIIK